ncbi:MAG: thioredoxin-disulfide reductase [candidate division WOR-3 bacterium]|nr:MAG: thioredoxin-disulfide reductase [candidate division WOR-3 bacterium]
MNKDNYDVIIIGAGPAGLTAGIYAARAGLRVTILERGLVGGLAATTHLIENYPGFPEGISGPDLTRRMKEQTERFGCHIIQSEVTGLKPHDRQFDVLTNAKTYTVSAVIVASGTVPKTLNVPGEDALRGRGVSYCAICDGPLFRDRDVAVVGCGNSGLQEGKFLLQVVKTVTFIEILPHMTADKILQDRLKNESRATFLLHHKLLSINGKERVTSVTTKNLQTNEEKTVTIDGIFIYIGVIPLAEFLKGIVDMDERGFIVTDEHLKTSVPGIFACGDIRSKHIRQVVHACAEGAEAAINAYHYIESLKDTNRHE